MDNQYIINLVINYLKIKDVKNCSLVCKVMNEVAKEYIDIHFC